MNNLLVLRERFKQIYVSHSLLVRKGAQFLLALLVFNLINSNIGFMKMASSVLCTVGLAVVCTFLPLAVMTAAATVLIVAHLYTLSMPIAGVAVILFLLMYIFYFRFTPEKSWLILLTVVAFGMKIPLVIPVIFGRVRYYSMDCPCILRNSCLLSTLPDQSFCNSIERYRWNNNDQHFNQFYKTVCRLSRDVGYAVCSSDRNTGSERN